MKNNDVEDMLLNSASLDELIRRKFEMEFKEDLEKSKHKEALKTYLNIKEVPQNKIFSKDSVFRYFSKKQMSETFINGIQADALIGLQDSVRSKMLKGELSAFTTGDAYVKFEKAIF